MCSICLEVILFLIPDSFADSGQRHSGRSDIIYSYVHSDMTLRLEEGVWWTWNIFQGHVASELKL